MMFGAARRVDWLLAVVRGRVLVVAVVGLQSEDRGS